MYKLGVKSMLIQATVLNTTYLAVFCNSACSQALNRTLSDYIEKSLEIRKALLDPAHPEIANSYNNLGNVVLQEWGPGAAVEANELFKAAVAIDMQQPEEERNLIQHIRNFNLAKSERLMGNPDSAYEYAQKGRQFAISTFGPECHFEATADFLCGNALFEKHQYAEAKVHWERAARIFRAENEIHPATTAADMKVAMADMALGEVSEGIASLEKTILLCRLNEQTRGDEGDSARMRWRLGQALIMNGQTEKGEDQQAIARKVRKAFQKDRFIALRDETFSYDLMVFVDFW